MEDVVSFGQWLKLRRQALRLTQVMLAERVPCSSELIRKIEADARRPSLVVAERLARQLGLWPQQQTLFVQVARAEARPDRLPPPAQVPDWPDTAGPAMQRNTLPAPTTSLIGREAELAELGSLLENPSCRLITILGPGGIGKTRLALAAATRQQTAFRHGAVFVPIAAISSATFLAPTILDALNVPLQGERDPREQLLAYLAEKELLLILDNFEPLLAPAVSENGWGAMLLSDMLQHAPGLTLLVTSRVRLGVDGEWLFDLSGLDYPMSEAEESIETYSAVQLFLQRAAHVRRQFTLEGETQAVARICRLTEGLPLAIELAAAALRSRSCASIVTALEQSLSTLSADLHGLPERHRSVLATFDYSWRLLSDDERHAFARLSVFRGGFEAGAAGQVAQASPQLLAALVDKSLLRWDGVARYDMHELVRQYASEKLRESDDEAHIRERHLSYFLVLAVEAERGLVGPQYLTWRRRLNLDLSNIRAALEWSLQSDPLVGLGLAAALRRYWEGHSPLQEGIGWLERLLQHPGAAAGTAIRARALTALGWLNAWHNEAAAREQAEEGLAIYRAFGDQRGVAGALLVVGSALCLQEGYAVGRPIWLESLALYRALGDPFGVSQALSMLGSWESNQDYGRARTYLEEGLRLCRELGDIVGMSDLLHGLGEAALRHGDYSAADAWLTEGLALQRNLGITSVASVIGTLGELALAQGAYEQARAYFEESLTLCREGGQTMMGLWQLVRLGYVALRQGDLEQARARFMEGLQHFNAEGDRIGIVYALEGLASLAVAQGRPLEGVRLFAWADTTRRAIAIARPPVDQADVERDLASVQGRLDEAAIEGAREEGRAMTLEQAVRCAAGLGESGSRHSEREYDLRLAP